MSYSYFFNNGNISQNGQAKYNNNQIQMNQQDGNGIFINIPNGDAQLNFSSINAFSSFKVVSSTLVNHIWNISVTVIKDDIRIQTRIDPISVKIDIDKSTDNFSELNDIVITNPQNGDVLAYDDNLNKFVNTQHSSSVTWNDITDKPTTFTPSAHGHTVNDILDFIPPAYYHGQWQCGSVTYNVNTPPTPGAGTFYFQHTTIYPNTYEMIINYTDLSAVNHTAEFEKLDYSSIIQIYSTDKTLKNKYIISQYVSIDGSTRKYYIDALQSSEEFTLVMMDSYQFDIVFYPVQDIDDLRNVAISNPINNQVLTYNGTDWINSAISGINKALMTVGWFYDVTDNYTVDTSYYFPYSAYGAALQIVGSSFSQVASVNTTSMLSSDLGSGKCGIKNISGASKQFLVMGKVSGIPTANVWVGFGVNDKNAVQIRQSRSNSRAFVNDPLTTHFHCILDIPNNDGVYIGGCTHANTDIRFNLFNIWLTVIEI